MKIHSSISRSLPQSTDSEKIVLGCCLKAPRKIDDIVTLGIEDKLFYSPSHNTLWGNLKFFRERHGDFDPVQLIGFLDDSCVLENCGGRVEILDMISQVPTLQMFDGHLEIIRDKARRRELHQLAERIQDSVYDPESAVKDIVGSIDTDTTMILDDVAPTRSTLWKDHLVDFQEAITERYTESGGEGKLPGIPTGVRGFDDRFSGWQSGKTYVVSGRPGDGKTALVMNLVSLVCEAGYSAGVFSLEMDASEMVLRAVARSAEIDSRDIEQGRLDEEEFREVTAATSSQVPWKLFIDDRPGLKPIDIEIQARRWVKESGVQIIFLDYVQLIQGNSRLSRVEVIDAASKTLKRISKDLGIPVVAIAQMGRAGAGDGRKMEHLKGSGAIEEDADVVVLLENLEVEEERDSATITIILLQVAKARGGRTGFFKMRFTKPYTLFEEL